MRVAQWVSLQTLDCPTLASLNKNNKTENEVEKFYYNMKIKHSSNILSKDILETLANLLTHIIKSKEDKLFR